MIKFDFLDDIPLDFTGSCHLIEDNSIRYYKNGIFHRVDGPALFGILMKSNGLLMATFIEKMDLLIFILLEKNIINMDYFIEKMVRHVNLKMERIIIVSKVNFIEKMDLRLNILMVKRLGIIKTNVMEQMIVLQLKPG